MAERRYEEIAGSGSVRVTTRHTLRQTIKRQLDAAADPSDLYESQISDFWANLTGVGFSPRLIERVWVASRCIQMNSQAISTMPLRHFGTREPAWVANPDPVWYPNGIGDAIFAAVWSMYGWGDAYIHITARYVDGYPSAWTVLNPEPISVSIRNGRRAYRSGQVPLNADDIVQISRDPRGGVQGTSALRSYASHANGLLAAADLGRVMMGSGGTPSAVLKSKKKINATQAAQVQEQWMTATATRRGAPAVLGPDLDFEQLAFSPKDLLLLEAQQFDAQVIASAFGVPASMLNMPIEGGLNYQTPVLLLEQWWRSELRPSAVRLSRALSSMMLPKGSYVEFDAREFLAPSFQDLVEAWVKLAAAGIVSPDELRAAVLSLPPSEQGPALEELTQPPSAGATPSQQSSSVIALRPTQAVSQ